MKTSKETITDKNYRKIDAFLAKVYTEFRDENSFPEVTINVTAEIAHRPLPDNIKLLDNYYRLDAARNVIARNLHYLGLTVEDLVMLAEDIHKMVPTHLIVGKLILEHREWGMEDFGGLCIYIKVASEASWDEIYDNYFQPIHKLIFDDPRYSANHEAWCNVIIDQTYED